MGVEEGGETDVVVVRLNEPVMDVRGTDQAVAGGRGFAVQRSALADVFPSDADSITEKMLARPDDGRENGACLKPDLTSKCEFWGVSGETKNRPALFAQLARFDAPPLLS